MPGIAVFPGQGSHAVGMGKELFDTFPVSKAVFDETDDALGEKLSDLIFRGPLEELTLTANAQPALMATSLAAVRAFEQVTGSPLSDQVEFAAGHSLGEYSALAAMGALTIGETAKLLRIRGAAMQLAVAVGDGAMAVILGLEVDAVEAIAKEASIIGVCEIANDNTAGQVVISGAKAAVDRACAIAKNKGAKRAMTLAVSAPFHCSLMEPAAADLAKALAETDFKSPARPVIANVDVVANSEASKLADLLTRQVTGRVRWRETMELMNKLEIDRVVEFGAGKVLTGMAKRAVPGSTLLNIQAPSDLDNLTDALKD